MGPFVSSLSNSSPDVIKQALSVISLSLQLTLMTGGAQVRSQVGSADSVFYFGTGVLPFHSPIALSPFNACFSFQALTCPQLLVEGIMGLLCAGRLRHE